MTGGGGITQAELRAHRGEILRSAKRRGARNVLVCGAMAMDRPGVNSDIDF